MKSGLFFKINLIACILALVVIVLGAYVRLSDAGLGCPDWPGCYGQITAPDEAEELTRAQLAYPHLDVDSGKAWKEMIHRYFASTLGLLIVGMAVLAWRNRRDSSQPVALPIMLVALVVFQGMLGMWTVTLLLKPVIVTLHLLMGLTTLSLLFYLSISQTKFRIPEIINPVSQGVMMWARVALIMIAIQLFLGGWTSTNYAALYCIDFPTCQGEWIPQLNLQEAYHFIGDPGVNYEGGLLSHQAGITVHFMHRLGALMTFLIVGGLCLRLLLRTAEKRLQQLALVVTGLLCIQVGLGIANVLLFLPLPVAVSHNAVAALLLLSVIALNYRVSMVTAVSSETTRDLFDERNRAQTLQY